MPIDIVALRTRFTIHVFHFLSINSVDAAGTAVTIVLSSLAKEGEHVIRRKRIIQVVVAG